MPESLTTTLLRVPMVNNTALLGCFTVDNDDEPLLDEAFPVGLCFVGLPSACTLLYEYLCFVGRPTCMPLIDCKRPY